MDISLEELIPLDEACDDIKVVFDKVDANGKVVLLRDNKPVYVIFKYNESSELFNKQNFKQKARYKLHDAMKLVLSEIDDKTMHAVDLADEIYKRGLYIKKDGTQAKSNQLRARANVYNHMFETLKNNHIKLIDLS